MKCKIFTAINGIITDSNKHLTIEDAINEFFETQEYKGNIGYTMLQSQSQDDSRTYLTITIFY